MNASYRLLLVKHKVLFYLHVQQTPNPLAHDPEAAPPFVVHSALSHIYGLVRQSSYANIELFSP